MGLKGEKWGGMEGGKKGGRGEGMEQRECRVTGYPSGLLLNHIPRRGEE